MIVKENVYTKDEVAQLSKAYYAPLGTMEHYDEDTYTFYDMSGNELLDPSQWDGDDEDGELGW